LGYAIIVFFIFAAFFVFIYNSLISRKNQVEQGASSIKAYMKKRADLIPNLLSIAETYALHEKNLISKIVELRTISNLQNETTEQLIKTSDTQSKSYKELLIILESYPDLKSDKNFLHLQKTISDIEDQLTAARRSYYSSVTFYNNGVEMIPHNLIAKIIGLEKFPLIDSQNSAGED
jgi:LemA protein